MSLLSRAAAALDRRYGWDRLPQPIAILTLVGLRAAACARRTSTTPRPCTRCAPPEGEMPPRATRTHASIDGSCNDVSNPRMGAVGARFGRNVPLDRTFPEAEPAILEPNPRLVSRELLTRKEFIPATTLNQLAGAWLQFEVHDWFSHGQSKTDAPWEVPLADDDPWGEQPDAHPAHAARPDLRRRSVDAADLRHRRQPLVGRLADLRHATQQFARRRSAPARTGSCASTSRADSGRTSSSTSTSRASRANFWVGLGVAAHAVHARAQRDLRRAARRRSRRGRTTSSTTARGSSTRR